MPQLTEIEKSILSKIVGELKIEVGLFKHKTDGQYGAMINKVNNHHFIYDASKWELIENIEVEATDRIRRCILEELCGKGEQIEEIIDRLENCKFESAYNIVKDTNIDQDIKKEFKKASEELGNCGWGGNLISDRADYLIKKVTKQC